MIQTPGTDLAVMEDGRRIGVSISCHERKIGPFSFGYRCRISVTGDRAFNKDIKTDRLVEVAIDPALGVVYAVGLDWKSAYGGIRDDAVALYTVDIAASRTEKTALGEISYGTFPPDFFKGGDGQAPFFLEYGPYEVVGYGCGTVREFRPLKIIDPKGRTRRQISKLMLSPSVRDSDHGISVIVPASEMDDLVRAGRCSESAAGAFIAEDIYRVKELNDRLSRTYLGRMLNLPVSSPEFENVSLDPLGIVHSLEAGDIYPRYRIAFDSSGHVMSGERLSVLDVDKYFSHLGQS